MGYARISLDPYMVKQIEEFQCPGCMFGPSPADCPQAKIKDDGDCFQCEGHRPGTMIGAPTWQQRIALGLPKGFCKVGPLDLEKAPMVRIWREGKAPQWNRLNAPVWKMLHEGALFVRTFMPRINYAIVDVIPGGTLDMCPGMNVAEFIDEID